MAKAAATPKPPTKSQLYQAIADKTGVAKKDVAAVFDSLTGVIEENIAKRGGPGQFTLPGLCKIVIQRKPATKERMGTNPFTGEQQLFAAKPARNVVKIRPLKALKDMV